MHHASTTSGREVEGQMSPAGVCFLLAGVMIAILVFCAVVQKCSPRPQEAMIGSAFTLPPITGTPISIEEAVIKAQAYERFQVKHGAAWKEAAQVQK